MLQLRFASLISFALLALAVAPIGANGQSYVQCGNGDASLCRSDYPICCGSFCATAGDKCCSSDYTTDHTCDPGQECCSQIDQYGDPQPTCCPLGSYCGGPLLGCITALCSTITDPGVCVSQFGSDPTSANNSQCSWCCDKQVCVPTMSASSVSNNAINNPNTQCQDVCAQYSTCDECTLMPNCLFDSSSQSCFSSGSGNNYNPFAVVSTVDQCSSILYWGSGITAASGPASGGFDIFSSSGKIIFIIFGILFFLCLIAICVSGARVAILVNRSTQDWENERDEIARGITAAVPRYGFAEAEEEDASNKKKASSKKKNFRTPLVAREDSETENNKNAETGEDDDSLCHLCHCHTQHQSRRLFVAHNGEAAENNKSPSTMEQAAAWNQVVLLPCYHRVCKDCVIKRAEANAASAAGYGAATMKMLSTVINFVNPFFSNKRTAKPSTQKSRSTESQTAINGSSTDGRKPQASEDTSASVLRTRPPSSEENETTRNVAPSREGEPEEPAGPTEPLIPKKKAPSTTEVIHASLEAPDVAEGILLDIFAGATVESHIQKMNLKKETRVEESSSSSDSDSEGHARPRKASKLPGATSKCPVCDSTVEFIFVPGKVLR